MQSQEYERFDIRVTWPSQSVGQIEAVVPSFSPFANCLLQDLHNHNHSSKLHRNNTEGNINISNWPHECYVRAKFGRAQSAEGSTIFIEVLPEALSSSPEPDVVLIGHSDECPARVINLEANIGIRLTLESKQAIRVAVCVMVVHKGKILLERRAKHMRTFPLRWVFPGGHVDKGESLEQAGTSPFLASCRILKLNNLHLGIREMWEEVGVAVKNLRPFAMWESWSLFLPC
jgi:hypothetical protein